jgi:hypothetical protein
MDKHVRTLAVLTIVAAILGLLAAAAILYFGEGRDGLLNISYEEKLSGDISLRTMPMSGLILYCLSIYMIGMAVLMIPTGIGLFKLQSWARWVAIALHGFNMLNIPLGTMLGLYALWVLMAEETDPLFEDKPYHRH